jgi:hypothetical protein
LDDVLVNKTVECQLNMMVHLDPNIRDKDQRLEIGIATFTKSQYTVFNFDTKQVGFGGAYNETITPPPTPPTPPTPVPPGPTPDPPGPTPPTPPTPNPPTPDEGMSAGTVIIITVVMLVVLGLAFLIYKRYQENRLVERIA